MPRPGLINQNGPNNPMMMGNRQQMGGPNFNNNSNMLPNGVPGIVGPYPNVNNNQMQQRMNTQQQQQQQPQQQQQSLLGNNPPGMMPIIRPGGPGNNFVPNNQRPSNGMMMMNQTPQSQPGAGLMGNRPPMMPGANNPIVPSSGPGLLPIRPGLTPMVQPGVSQGPGLLSNPGVAVSRMGVSGQQPQRNDWDRSNTVVKKY